jgi:hypothetical protein
MQTNAVAANGLIFPAHALACALRNRNAARAGDQHVAAARHIETSAATRVHADVGSLKEVTMRFILLWLLGVPVSVLFVLWLLHII